MKHLPRLPKRFFIDDDEVIVLFVPQKTLKSDDGSPAEGVFYSTFSPKQIRIAKHLSRSRKWQVLFHEVMHVVEELERLEDIDEPTIDGLAKGWYKLFVRNNWDLPGE